MVSANGAWRYITDGVVLLSSTAGFVNEMFLKDKPDSGLVTICLGAAVGIAVRAGVTARAQAADTTEQSSGSPQPPSSSQ